METATEARDGTGGELEETLSALRSALDRAAELARRTGELLSAPLAGAPGDLRSLELRIGVLERERRSMYRLLAESERHRTQLISSYVATYQLHSTLDPAEVEATIAEVASNVLGVESFALLLREDAGEQLRVALSEGGAEVLLGGAGGAVYRGEDPMVERALARGELLVGPLPGSPALAVIPLASQGTLVGALVLLRLLEHRAALCDDDRELLEIVGAHAASALLASRAYAASERRLRTLQGLVELARGR